MATGGDDKLPASPMAARQSSLSLSLLVHPSTCAHQQVAQPSINDTDEAISDQLAPIRAVLVSSRNSCSLPEHRQECVRASTRAPKAQKTPNLGQQLLTEHPDVAAETPLRMNARHVSFVYSKGPTKRRFNQLKKR